MARSHVSLRYREKFNAALYALAVREGDVRARLRSVYRYLHMLRPDEVPAEHREEWAQILAALTQRGPERGPSGEVLRGALEHTLGRMRNSSGRRIAERVYSLARQID